MPLFIMSMNWTEKGIKSIRDWPKRLKAARDHGKKCGFSFKAPYLSLITQKRTSGGATLASIAAQGICAPFNPRSVIPTIRYLGIEVDDASEEQVDVNGVPEPLATYSLPTIVGDSGDAHNYLIIQDKYSQIVAISRPGRRRGSARRYYGLLPGAG